MTFEYMLSHNLIISEGYDPRVGELFPRGLKKILDVNQYDIDALHVIEATVATLNPTSQNDVTLHIDTLKTSLKFDKVYTEDQKSEIKELTLIALNIKTDPNIDAMNASLKLDKLMFVENLEHRENSLKSIKNSDHFTGTFYEKDAGLISDLTKAGANNFSRLTLAADAVAQYFLIGNQTEGGFLTDVEKANHLGVTGQVSNEIKNRSETGLSKERLEEKKIIENESKGAIKQWNDAEGFIDSTKAAAAIIDTSFKNVIDLVTHPNEFTLLGTTTTLSDPANIIGRKAGKLAAKSISGITGKVVGTKIAESVVDTTVGATIEGAVATQSGKDFESTFIQNAASSTAMSQVKSTAHDIIPTSHIKQNNTASSVKSTPDILSLEKHEPTLSTKTSELTTSSVKNLHGDSNLSKSTHANSKSESAIDKIENLQSTGSSNVDKYLSDKYKSSHSQSTERNIERD